MKAIDYVSQQLLGEEQPYGSQYVDQPKVQITVRLPLQLVGWLEILKAQGLGNSRTDVMSVLLDVAIEKVVELGVVGDDAATLEDMVHGYMDQWLEAFGDQEEQE